MFFLLISCLLIISSLVNCQISPSYCGVRPLSSNKVISGTKAIPGDWAWSVSMTNNGRHFCGGILINSNTVLTAAHCFGGSSLVNPAYSIDVGVHNRLAKESWVQTRSFSKLFVHERFSMNTLQNDIAIIKLSSPITLNDTYAVPICLDESDVTPSELDPQLKTGWLTGWGHERYQGVLTVEKMQGFIQILSDVRCKQRYSTLYNTTSQICAGENDANAGACQGDSGGPFVIKSTSDSRWYLVGLVSWGYGCGQGTVFTRVKSFLPWITSKMALF